MLNDAIRHAEDAHWHHTTTHAGAHPLSWGSERGAPARLLAHARPYVRAGERGGRALSRRAAPILVRRVGLPERCRPSPWDPYRAHTAQDALGRGDNATTVSTARVAPTPPRQQHSGRVHHHALRCAAAAAAAEGRRTGAAARGTHARACLWQAAALRQRVVAGCGEESAAPQRPAARMPHCHTKQTSWRRSARPRMPAPLRHRGVGLRCAAACRAARSGQGQRCAPKCGTRLTAHRPHPPPHAGAAAAAAASDVWWATRREDGPRCRCCCCAPATRRCGGARCCVRQHIAAAAADLTQSARCRLRAMCKLLRLAVQQQQTTACTLLREQNSKMAG
jgi:hypothetical protein